MRAVVLLLLPLALRAEPILADSAVRAVLVYPDRAQVTREARVDLAAGVNEIVLGGLPARIDPDSVRVTGTGPGWTLLDVAVAKRELERTPDPRLGTLEARIQELDREVAVIEDERRALDQQRQFLGRIEVASLERIGRDLAVGAPRPTGEEIAALAEAIGRRYGEIAAANRALLLQADAKRLERDALARQAQVLQPQAGALQENRVTARIRADTAGSGLLSVTYVQGGTAWGALYDARLDAGQRQLALTYRGRVFQNTGEDWRDVSVTLSTAQPARGGAAPEPPAWVLAEAGRAVSVHFELNQLDQDPAEGAARGNARSASLAAVGDGAPPPAFMRVPAADVRVGTTSALFRIEAPATIPADNTPHAVTISETVLPVQLEYHATPRVTPSAFLRAVTRNTTGAPLVGGELRAFLDGAFVATSRLDSVAPDAELALDLGVDDGIRVERVLRNRFTEQTGLTGGGRRVTYDALITVTNTKSSRVRVVVREPYPISRDERIVVRIAQPAERDAVRDPAGYLVWTLELAPGEKRELPVRLSVDHPAGLAVDGLD